MASRIHFALRKRALEFSVAGAAGLAYVRASRAEVFWDDEFLSTRNPYLSSLSGVRFLLSHDLWIASAKGEPGGYWRPLASLSLAINRAIGGNTAASYHWGNILLHACVAAGVVALGRAVGLGRWIAAMAALGFATTPLGSEAVIWISGRFDLLGALLAVVACLMHAKNRPIAAAVAVAGAVACKETFVIVPAVLAAYELCVRRGPARLRHWVSGPGVGMITVGAYLAARSWVGVASATQAAANAGLGASVSALASVVETLHLGLVYPPILSPFHLYSPPSVLRCAASLGALFLITVSVVIAARRPNASPHMRVVAFGWLWWLMGIAPTTLTAANQFVFGDRYAYFPMVGLALAAGAVVASAARRLRSFTPAPVAAGFALLVAFNLYALELRITEWLSAEALLEVTAARDPKNFYVLFSVGSLRAQQHRYAEAEALLLAAHATAPGPGDSASGFTWPIDTALCFVYLNQQRYPEAEAACRSRLARAPNDPRAWVNLATVELRQGRFLEAIASSSAALSYRPSYIEGRLVRSIALRAVGQTDASRADAEQVLRLDPTNPRAQSLSGRQ